MASRPYRVVYLIGRILSDPSSSPGKQSDASEAKQGQRRWLGRVGGGHRESCRVVGGAGERICVVVLRFVEEVIGAAGGLGPAVVRDGAGVGGLIVVPNLKRRRSRRGARGDGDGPELDEAGGLGNGPARAARGDSGG